MISVVVQFSVVVQLVLNCITQFQLKKGHYVINIVIFTCNGNIIHININDYEGTHNVWDVLNGITYKGEVNLRVQGLGRGCVKGLGFIC